MTAIREDLGGMFWMTVATNSKECRISVIAYDLQGLSVHSCAFDGSETYGISHTLSGTALANELPSLEAAHELRERLLKLTNWTRTDADLATTEGLAEAARTVGTDYKRDLDEKALEKATEELDHEGDLEEAP